MNTYENVEEQTVHVDTKQNTVMRSLNVHFGACSLS